MKITDEKQIKDEYTAKLEYLKSNNLNFDDSCIVFVYNSIAKTSNDDLHISECVYEDEIALIEDAFHAINNLRLYSFDSEDEFISLAPELKKQYHNVYVYSMAQNLSGAGRRCLIPLLCEYYGFINISSNSSSSFLGGNKRLMHDLLQSNIRMPQRLFLTDVNEALIKNFISKYNKILLKPNSESASIGIKKFDSSQQFKNIVSLVRSAISEYKTVILEEFIEGTEVECTILPWNGNIFAAPPVKILKDNDYLDYVTVANDNYDFEIYNNNLSNLIIEQAKKAYSILRFDSVGRFDFIVSGDKAYLFDITPNPTISKCSSANLSIKFINNDDRTIYLILLLNKLLIPSFDKTK
ncbi:MAG: hypothetical protein K2L12_03630 [Clostridia bacterium]|nr:hypothetical protein [Clostridia bacterium]